jgi:hypothetical protein
MVLQLHSDNTYKPRPYATVGDFRASTSDFGAIKLHIQNYSNATTYKTVLTRANIRLSYVFANVSIWRSTVAINKCSIKR